MTPNPHRGSDFAEFMIEQGLTNTDQPMTPTPRTDAAETLWNDAGCHVVHADFARQLERENQTFRAAQKACEDCDAPRVDRIAELERELAEARENEIQHVLSRAKAINDLREQLAAERALADRLGTQLEGIMDEFEYSHEVDFNSEDQEALAAWKEARSE
jgi:hypothetical protein